MTKPFHKDELVAPDRRIETMLLGQEAKKAWAVQEADRGMSKPMPIVLIFVGIGVCLFGLHIFGIQPFQYKWVLAISMCLVLYGAYLYAIEKRPNSN
jgi:hypothetical protein